MESHYREKLKELENDFLQEKEALEQELEKMKEEGFGRRDEEGLLRMEEEVRRRDEGWRNEEEEEEEEEKREGKDERKKDGGGWREEMEAFNYVENTENNKKIEENYSINYVIYNCEKKEEKKKE